VRIFFWLLLLLGPGFATVQAQDTPASASDSSAAPALLVPGLKVSPALTRPNTPDKQMPAFLEARDMRGDGENNVVLRGNASVRRQDAVIKANIINYNQRVGVMDAQGDARLIRDGNIVSGTSITYNTEDGTASIDQPNFWLDSGGAGVGSWADVFNRNQMSLTDVTYSGCPCPNPSWYIESEKLDLDFAENEGVATNGVLYFKDVPILASPYLTFPLKKERKSGFLLPTFGTTTNTGADFTQPYYFNLAPNYDMTLQERAMSKHGLQLGDEFRYMGESYSGYMAGTYLNKDITTGTDRWLYSASHMQSFGKGFYGFYSLNGVSDDNYFQDFASIAVNQANTAFLPKMASLGWSDQYWQTSLTMLTFQTIVPSGGTTVVPQYNKVPEYALNGARFDYGGFDFQTQNTVTQFQMPLDQRFALGPDGSLRWKPDGTRAASYSSIAYPIVQPGWFVTPKVALSLSQYQTQWYGLENFLGYGGQPDVSRALPIMSVDSGMTFDRETTFFGKPSLQTIEPRAYYLRVPYRDQSQIPVYDTTLADLNFSSIFQENIFAGNDRISNANQVTLAMTTRWLDEDTGFERLSLGLAQQFYFEDQLVTLPGEIPRTDTRSLYLLGANAALTDTTNTTATLQYNPYTTQWDRMQFVMRWRPQRLAMMSVSYRYQINPPPDAIYQTPGQNQVSTAFQWPLTKKWYGVGRMDYTFNKVDAQSLIDPTVTIAQPKITQAILGLEYKGDCCWSGRMLFQRYIVSADQTNTAVFFQLELSGLGSLGQNPMGVLGRSIPDYQNVNSPIPNVTKFERYE